MQIALRIGQIFYAHFTHITRVNSFTPAPVSIVYRTSIGSISVVTSILNML